MSLGKLAREWLAEALAAQGTSELLLERSTTSRTGFKNVKLIKGKYYQAQRARIAAEQEAAEAEAAAREAAAPPQRKATLGEAPEGPRDVAATGYRLNARRPSDQYPVVAARRSVAGELEAIRDIQNQIRRNTYAAETGQTTRLPRRRSRSPAGSTRGPSRCRRRAPPRRPASAPARSRRTRACSRRRRRCRTTRPPSS